MNQGSLPRFDNGFAQDGAIFFHFPDGHWVGVFLAFASQAVKTNAKGLPEPGSPKLNDVITEVQPEN